MESKAKNEQKNLDIQTIRLMTIRLYGKDQNNKKVQKWKANL